MAVKEKIKQLENNSEMRCPEHKFRLFAKVVKVDKDTNCFEIRCRECSKAYTKKMKRKVDVFHYYDLAGLVETKIKTLRKEEENGSNNNNSRGV